jgi:hypothetical protein
MPRPKKVTTTEKPTAPKPVRKRPVRVKPVEPPPVQEVPTVATDALQIKRSWKEKLDSVASVLVLACAVCFLGTMAATAYIKLRGEPKPDDQTVVVDDKAEAASKLFIEQYRANLSQVYADAAKQSFKDLGEARDYVEPRRKAAIEQAFKPMGEQLETINGDKFDPAKAKAMFESFAKGLAK